MEVLRLRPVVMTMNNYLFPNFLNDAQDYARVQTLWQERWLDLVRRVGQQELWTTPWLNTNFANGTPFQDGNPIFSALCSSRRQAIRVIQLEPADDAGELEFWTDTFAKGEPEEIEELVVSCVLTDVVLGEVEELMQQWITGQKIRFQS